MRSTVLVMVAVLACSCATRPQGEPAQAKGAAVLQRTRSTIVLTETELWERLSGSILARVYTNRELCSFYAAARTQRLPASLTESLEQAVRNKGFDPEICQIGPSPSTGDRKEECRKLLGGYTQGPPERPGGSKPMIQCPNERTTEEKELDAWRTLVMHTVATDPYGYQCCTLLQAMVYRTQSAPWANKLAAIQAPLIDRLRKMAQYDYESCLRSWVNR